MLIKEIISESINEEFNSQFDIRVSPRAVKHLIRVLSKYSEYNHDSVKTDALLGEVSASLGEPFTKDDLLAANEQSEEVQELIDTADDDKIKLKGQLDIKNEDPEVEAEKKNATVSSMAARRASKGL